MSEYLEIDYLDSEEAYLDEIKDSAAEIEIKDSASAAEINYVNVTSNMLAIFYVFKHAKMDVKKNIEYFEGKLRFVLRF